MLMITQLLDKCDVHRAMHRNIISIVKPTRCTNVSNLTRALACNPDTTPA